MSIPLDARWPLQFQAAMTRELREEGERLVLGEIGPSPALSEENSLPKLVHFGLFPISAFGLFPISAFGPHSDDFSRCRLREVKFSDSRHFGCEYLEGEQIICDSKSWNLLIVDNEYMWMHPRAYAEGVYIR